MSAGASPCGVAVTTVTTPPERVSETMVTGEDAASVSLRSPYATKDPSTYWWYPALIVAVNPLADSVDVLLVGAVFIAAFKNVEYFSCCAPSFTLRRLFGALGWPASNCGLMALAL